MPVPLYLPLPKVLLEHFFSSHWSCLSISIIFSLSVMLKFFVSAVFIALSITLLVSAFFATLSIALPAFCCLWSNIHCISLSKHSPNCFYSSFWTMLLEPPFLNHR
jgi:hypothetical protein